MYHGQPLPKLGSAQQQIACGDYDVATGHTILFCAQYQYAGPKDELLCGTPSKGVILEKVDDGGIQMCFTDSSVEIPREVPQSLPAKNYPEIPISTPLVTKAKSDQPVRQFTKMFDHCDQKAITPVWLRRPKKKGERLNQQRDELVDLDKQTDMPRASCTSVTHTRSNPTIVSKNKNDITNPLLKSMPSPHAMAPAFQNGHFSMTFPWHNSNRTPKLTKSTSIMLPSLPPSAQPIQKLHSTTSIASAGSTQLGTSPSFSCRGTSSFLVNKNGRCPF